LDHVLRFFWLKLHQPNDFLPDEEANTLLTTIGLHYSWENGPYVTQLLQRLDA